METLVVAEHRNQYYSRVKAYKHARFGCSPSSHFREINCRTFQSGSGILPTPFETSSTTVTKITLSPPTCSPQSTQTSTIKGRSKSHTGGNTHTKTALKSSPIPINIPKRETPFDAESESSPFSELWAGPAYSNSPPPSSLPIPKFSMRPKRTVSLELPVSDSGIKGHPIAKSAPASPTRERCPSTKDLFLSVDSATKTLRRILNLDVADD